jgi:prophage regulatory protein
MEFIGGLPGLRKRGIRWTRQYIMRLEKRGKFPKRLRVGANSVEWLAHEIDDWISARTAERDQEAAAAAVIGSKPPVILCEEPDSGSAVIAQAPRGGDVSRAL